MHRGNHTVILGACSGFWRCSVSQDSFLWGGPFVVTSVSLWHDAWLPMMSDLPFPLVLIYPLDTSVLPNAHLVPQTVYVRRYSKLMRIFDLQWTRWFRILTTFSRRSTPPGGLARDCVTSVKDRRYQDKTLPRKQGIPQPLAAACIAVFQQVYVLALLRPSHWPVFQFEAYSFWGLTALWNSFNNQRLLLSSASAPQPPHSHNPLLPAFLKS